MQILCVICSDLITPTALNDLIGLACGHIFHGMCIRTWLDRSATCPHCRAKVTGSKQYKVFLDIAPEPEGQDIISLTRSVDNLKYDLKLKNMECNNLSKDLEKYKSRASGLVKEVRKLESQIASVAEVTLQLNEQRKHANIKAKELCEAKFIIESLENELQQYQTLKSMVNNASGEIDVGVVDVKSLDSTQLTFLLHTFKKDITRLSKIDEELKKTLSKTESEKLSLIKKNQDLQEDLHLKDRVIESLKESFAKKKERVVHLKKKLNDLVKNKTDSLNESNAESDSPLPALAEVQQHNSVTAKFDNSQHEKENWNEQSSSSVINGLSFSKSTFRITSDRFRSISQLGPSLKPSTSTNGLSYDGMGGHSRVDIFPSSYKLNQRMSKISKMGYKKRKL